MTAEATAKQTTLEGNAEAGIVLSKGEAEAKALALRAEAYRQFNEAAIIQTVLSMLPDIVRAAAEPMGNIDHLTVLSNDGASDVVKNVTRTVTEASATVKGLTGIDIPELLNQAMGGAGRAAVDGPSGGTRTRPPSGPKGGGSGGGGTTGGGRPRRRPAPAVGRPPRRPAASAADEPPPAPQRPAPAARRTPPTTAGTGRRRGSRRPEAVDAAMADADRAVRAAVGAADRRAPTRPPARPARHVGRRPASPTSPARRPSTTPRPRLAADLRAVPGIERFAEPSASRELERSGPRPLRTMWRIARDQLDERYGQLTIGELIERYGSGPSA